MTRIPFYVSEVTFMDDNDPRKPGNRMSYKEIADELNRRWPQFNQGQRSRGTVIDYYNRKRQQDRMAVRLISIPKHISDTLSSDDIQRIIVSHASPIGTRRS